MVLGVLMVVYYFITGRRVGVGRVASDSSDLLPGDGYGGTAAAFFEGVVSVLAMSELASSSRASTGPSWAEHFSASSQRSAPSYANGGRAGSAMSSCMACWAWPHPSRR